jgi:Signal transduction histidine kinase regulating C4-dicarboxylate transport system
MLQDGTKRASGPTMTFPGIPDEALAATYAQVLDAARAIIWRADARTFQTTFVTPGAEVILGYPVRSWLEIPGFWVEHVHPDDRQAVIALSSAATREGRMHDFEYRMIAADGRVLWLRNIVNVLMANGVPESLIGVTVDRTDARQAELETDHLRRELTALGRFAERDEFGVMLAHELNQPLGALVSNAETARLLVARAGGDPQLQQLLGDIESDAHRATGIVVSLRRLGSKLPALAGETAIIPAIESALRVSAPLLSSERISVERRVPADLPAVQIDPVQFQQVFINLLQNAVEAMTRADAVTRRIDITGRLTRGTVAITVADAGTGVPLALRARVFERGYSTKVNGLGMGLAICRSIVESCGGTIAFDDAAGAGAAVTVTLKSAPRG